MDLTNKERAIALVVVTLLIIVSIWWAVHEAIQCATVGGNYHPATQYQHSQCERSYQK